MDITNLLDSRKFCKKVNDLVLAIRAIPKRKEIPPEDIKEYLEELIEAADVFPTMAIDPSKATPPTNARAKAPVHVPEPVDNLKILLEAKAKGQKVIILKDISPKEIHKLWTEAQMGWTPTFQAVDGGWKIAEDFNQLQSGSVG